MFNKSLLFKKHIYSEFSAPWWCRILWCHRRYQDCCQNIFCYKTCNFTKTMNHNKLKHILVIVSPCCIIHSWCITLKLYAIDLLLPLTFNKTNYNLFDLTYVTCNKTIHKCSVQFFLIAILFGNSIKKTENK